MKYNLNVLRHDNYGHGGYGGGLGDGDVISAEQTSIEQPYHVDACF